MVLWRVEWVADCWGASAKGLPLWLKCPFFQPDAVELLGRRPAMWHLSGVIRQIQGPRHWPGKGQQEESADRRPRCYPKPLYSLLWCFLLQEMVNLSKLPTAGHRAGYPVCAPADALFNWSTFHLTLCPGDWPDSSPLALCLLTSTGFGWWGVPAGDWREESGGRPLFSWLLPCRATLAGCSPWLKLLPLWRGLFSRSLLPGSSNCSPDSGPRSYYQQLCWYKFLDSTTVLALL